MQRLQRMQRKGRIVGMDSSVQTNSIVFGHYLIDSNITVGVIGMECKEAMMLDAIIFSSMVKSWIPKVMPLCARCNIVLVSGL